ncbi:site-2 protease family protein [Mycolicibacterium fluoranthenivorans]|uniref:Zinc metalloprotease n=1 Tax=Mycolicibacterium fluoranthenivorans TaxID=258505 RepID=A0A7X5U1E2_9MYCO|nr:site-2 protease family protein [Mycolicibacterium fluoranthenivorans]MCV7354807.1 site-2 protease family protein [Mycolicibacterium fluoranthenivorans]NIH96606.1 Zn-dependent protease/predicted transcriptional regulator [Mycolicibacterium fluoranthenivorans]
MDTIPIGRIAGFAVRINWSVLVILWLFTWSLASTLPGAAPGYPQTAYWVAGICGALILLGSLLAHELTHAVLARRAGVTVSDVTLWLFGGVTRLGGDAKTPKEAFRIAVSGPLTSLAIAVVFGVTGYGLGALGAAPILVGVASWLAGINLMLGLFNLLPGAPLDGGRVLRAYLWRRYGDPVRAGVGAARVGRVLAFVLIALGLGEFLAGATVGGVWLVFLGWFIFAASREEEAQVRTQHAFDTVRVADVMTAHPHTAPGDITVEEFIARYLLGDRHSAYPVTDRDGSVIGLISLSVLRRIAPGRRTATLVREAAMPLSAVTTTTPDESVTALLQRLAAKSEHRALVVDSVGSGGVVGIVTASDLTRLIEVYQLAGAGQLG